MPSFRLPRREPAASGPDALEDAPRSEPAGSPTGNETTSPHGAIVESEELEGRPAASGPNEAAPGEGEETPDEDPVDWRTRYADADEMWAAFQHVDRLRGRLANEVGEHRRQARILARALHLAAMSPPTEAAALLEAASLSIRTGDSETLAAMVSLGESARTARAVGERHAEPREVVSHA
jgi:hypothetical protein